MLRPRTPIQLHGLDTALLERADIYIIMNRTIQCSQTCRTAVRSIESRWDLCRETLTMCMLRKQQRDWDGPAEIRGDDGSPKYTGVLQ